MSHNARHELKMKHPSSQLVYVIVLNWNGWKDTIECLSSLRHSDYPNYEIVVVDNNSEDDSVVRIREAHPQVPIIQAEDNLGFAGGNNLGIRYALSKGAEFVWLLNNDTKVMKNTLSSMVELAMRNPDVGVVGSAIYEMDPPNKLQAWGGGRVDMFLGRARKCRKGSNPDYITGASMLIRRQLLEEVGLLDERFFMYWEDTDFCFRARKRGWKIAVEPSSVVFHKESASIGKKSDTLFSLYTESSLYFFDKHSPYPLITKANSMLFRLIKRLVKMEISKIKPMIRGLQKYLERSNEN